MANTVTKIKDLYVVYANGGIEEIVDTSTNLTDFIYTAIDVTVEDESNKTQEYRIVMGKRTQLPKNNLMVFELEYYIKTGLGNYALDSVIPHKVTKNNYVDVTDPDNLVWLEGGAAYENGDEILDEESNSYSPKRYEQVLKSNVMAESNFFVKTFGIGVPSVGQYSFEFEALFNQAVKNLS